ncbi:RNA-binding protein [Halohasta litchfieldiae]|jgi:RNA-binding protein|uniref:snoRNP protein GAR1 n=1 Tax=Halohasta litchfieldiae TaxID=1073996 RepID=A0A1H6TEN3_9EURY|nr:Gar1/Naf1 family protein [Halohasta litchfieldiae]ATW87647.1 RNA-binding protein [Halohasta litchfieldiae]SEI76634.1 snoRNP protein GAR1 [Halohasta litchfieldiae]
MRRIGTVDRTAQGLAIVNVDSDDVPDIGLMVINESLTTVGRIVDVFGPVDGPYVAITPTSSTGLTELVGTKLYAR